MIQILIFLFSFLLHPYYISNTNISIKNDEIQIETQYFLDDIEQAIKKNYKLNNIDISQNNIDSNKKYVMDYINKKLYTKINDEFVLNNFLGYEIENGNIICYISIPHKNLKLNKLTIYNSVLYELKKEQTHYLNLKYNNKSQNVRIQNPVNYYIFNFN